jgi:hypothetical protein
MPAHPPDQAPSLSNRPDLKPPDLAEAARLLHSPKIRRVVRNDGKGLRLPCSAWPEAIPPQPTVIAKALTFCVA